MNRKSLLVCTMSLSLGCASAGSLGQSRVFVAESRTTQSEASVVSCATSYRDSRAGFGTGDSETTAFGRGSIGNSVYFKTARTGDVTVLTVYAESYSYPASGSGLANSNTVPIAVTPEAKAKARALLASCAGAS